MGIKLAKNLEPVEVTVYAMAKTKYYTTETASLTDEVCDIYFSTIENGELDNIGADNHHYSIKDKDEMVFVNKALLQALVDQCQRYSDNNGIYDDTRGNQFEYSDLNDLVMGMEFPESVTSCD